MELQIQSLKIKFKVDIDMSSSAIYLAKARTAEISRRSVQFRKPDSDMSLHKATSRFSPLGEKTNLSGNYTYATQNGVRIYRDKIYARPGY